MKGIKYTIEEKNNIVIESLNGSFTKQDIIRKYSITSRTMLDNWIRQYKVFGTTTDKRGRPKKEASQETGYDGMTKEELIRELKFRDDLKKALVYLKMRKTNTK